MVNVAIVGATGEVGKAFLKVLEERSFPVKELRLFASLKSEGKTVIFKGHEYKVEALEKQDSFKGIDIALFSAGSSVSKEWAPKFAKDGAVVIDNSSAWRMDEDVPLVVPEVNKEDIKKHKGIIANPNCSTIQMLVAIKPIYDEFSISKIIVSTYQAVSGAGAKAIEELKIQTENWCQKKRIEPNSILPKRIAFNVIPQIDVFLEDGYTKEETKMLNETRKMLHDNDIRVSATTVRVPVFYGHSEAISLELKKEIDIKKIKDILRKAPGVILMDEPADGVYPIPIVVEGRDEVFVGRIRKDRAFDNGISMWVVADNIRKGAATNAIQIAEVLINEGG